MVKRSYLQTKNPNFACDLTGLSSQDIEGTIDRFNNGRAGNAAAADQFLKKMKVATRSMANTVEAAKPARQRIFAMIASFGLPASLVTVTPKDDEHFFSFFTRRQKKDV